MVEEAFGDLAEAFGGLANDLEVGPEALAFAHEACCVLHRDA